MTTTELTERCDRCPAQAQIQFFHERDKTDLVFCNHHYQRYALTLFEQGFTMVGAVEQ